MEENLTEDAKCAGGLCIEDRSMKLHVVAIVVALAALLAIAEEGGYH